MGLTEAATLTSSIVDGVERVYVGGASSERKIRSARASPSIQRRSYLIYKKKEKGGKARSQSR